jgi:hypothetical protein
MKPPDKKPHPVRKALFWLFLVVFVCSIAFMFVSSDSSTPRAETRVRAIHPGARGSVPPSSSSTSLATVTAVISAAGTLSTMVIAWAQFVRDRKKSGTSVG